MSNVTYRLARGTIKLPRDPKRTFTTSGDFIKQGDMIPSGVLSPEQVKSMLSDGRIECMQPAEAALAVREPKYRGKWGVDPTALVGKSLEDLLVMVQEIDEDFDVTTLANEVDAVRQLTMDWDPAFRETIARASDRSRPERLRHTTSKTEGGVEEVRGAKDAGQRPMAPAAEEALARAKERAQTRPEPSSGDTVESHG